MRTKKNAVAQVTGEVGEFFDELTIEPPGVIPSLGTLSLEAYHGHGTRETLFVRARVRRGGGVGEVGEEDSRWRNLFNTVRRVNRRRAPDVRVIASFQGTELQAVSDRNGFVEFEMPVTKPLQGDCEWWEVELRAFEEGKPEPPVRATARVIVPTSSAEYGVISDIDDTVVRTEVTNWLRMLKIVLLTNAYTRTPFEHVETLYHAFRQGPRGDSQNPVFYVSSSPWGFYDLLEHFFRIHGLPEGPLFLKTYQVSLKHLRGSSHHNHKLHYIRMLFDTYPELPFVLVGDSGQEDPEIYREVVRDYPDRVLAIFIRDVTSSARDEEVHAIAEDVEEMGVEMALVEDKLSAGVGAIRLGLIEEHWLARMREEKANPEGDATNSSPKQFAPDGPRSRDREGAQRD
jgi:phosphatidate phosphatase APP1